MVCATISVDGKASCIAVAAGTGVTILDKGWKVLTNNINLFLFLSEYSSLLVCGTKNFA